MPSWLKPSGNFGIGFQSIFMLTERVNLKSKSLFSQESIDVDLIKPASKNYNAGSIYFKKTKFDYKQEIGTVINFRYRTKKVSNSYTTSGEFTNNYIYAFDPLIDEEFDIEIFSLLDMVSEVNSYSLLDIILKKENKEIPLKKSLDENSKEDLKFLAEENYQISLDILDETINRNRRFSSIFFYKNQFVEEINYLSNKFFNITINILNFKVNDVLELNRNKLKDSFIKKEKDLILNEIFNTLYKLYNNSFGTMNEHVKRKISYFWLAYRDSLNLKIEDKLDFEKKLENFLYQDEIVEGISVNSLKAQAIIEIEIIPLKDTGFSYKIENKEIDEYFLKFLIKEISIKGYYILKIDNNREIKEGYKIILEKVDSEAKEYIDLEYNIKNFVNTKGWFNPIGRFYIHSNKDTKNLKINYKDMNLKSNQEWIGLRRISILYDIFDSLLLRNFILFPFYIKSANEVIWNEKIKKEYIEFCYKNRFFKDLSEEDIRKVVEKFVEDLKKKFLDENIKISEN